MNFDRLTIIHVLPGEPYGGAQILVLSLAEAQMLGGDDVLIITTNPSKRFNAACSAKRLACLELKGSRFLRAARLCRELWKQRRAIVHTHCEPAWATPAVAAVKSRLWISHVHLYPDQTNYAERLASFLRRLSVDHFIAASQSLGAALEVSEKVAVSRITVVYNGIEMIASTRAAKALNTTRLNIGFVGRLEPEKGTILLLEVAKALAVDPKLHFIVVGCGSEADRMRVTAINYQLEDRFTFRGFVADPVEIWSDIDIFLMLSKREPFGLVVLEALSFGVAVMGLDTESGSSEIMQQLSGCYLVKGGSDSVADAVRSLVIDFDEVVGAAESGKRQVSAKFSILRMLEGIRSVYTRLDSIHTT